MESAETVIYLEGELETNSVKEVLGWPWKKIVIDVGCNGMLSSAVEQDELMVLVDPNMNPKKLKFGNENYNLGRIIAIKGEAEDLPRELEGRADRVQIIAPTPNLTLRMINQSEKYLKPYGEIVILFDTTSEQKLLIPEVIRQIQEEFKNEFDVSQPKKKNLVQAGECVEGELNSELIPGYATWLLLEKK